MSPDLQCVDRDRWRQLTPLFRDHNYRQLWAFGTGCAERIGAVNEHVAIVAGNEILGLADVRIKRVPFFRTGIAYVAGGPLVRRGDGLDGDRLRICLQTLTNKYVPHYGLFLRIQPPLGDAGWNEQQARCFAALGFRPARHTKAYRTIVVDLSQSADDLRKGLAQKWRNCLNRAEQNRLTIRSGRTRELFEEFCSLYTQLRDRKGFDVDLDADFYARVQSSSHDSEQFRVTLADVNGITAAGHVSSMLGDTCVYLLGASNELGMQSKASYILQWQTILDARAGGCRWYDLGGIDPETNPGVYHFKNGLGGCEFCVPGPFEMTPAGAKKYVASVLERAYRAVHRMCAQRV